MHLYPPSLRPSVPLRSVTISGVKWRGRQERFDWRTARLNTRHLIELAGTDGGQLSVITSAVLSSLPYQHSTPTKHPGCTRLHCTSSILHFSLSNKSGDRFGFLSSVRSPSPARTGESKVNIVCEEFLYLIFTTQQTDNGTLELVRSLRKSLINLKIVAAEGRVSQCC